jgi:farnesyl-diphosphate farnesyltransferase
MDQVNRFFPTMPALLRGVSRSFYLSIRLLPGRLRQPVAVGYLLARASDTLADTADLPPDERRDMLESWTEGIEGHNTGSAAAARLAASFGPLQRDTQERALIEALPQCLSWLEELPSADRADIRAVLRHITYGQALDIERFDRRSPLRALDSAAQLDEYTYLVAGSVGEFWTDLCFRHVRDFARLPRPEMRELGRAYGKGLQLVNILRDAGSDLAAGRCYFPAEELAQAGLRPQDILAKPERFEPVWQRWHAQAGRDLDLGMQYADAVNGRRVRAASALPALLGARTLDLLRAAGPGRLRQPVKMARHEVRSILARLAFTLAGRAPLQRSYRRLRGGEPATGWDNPRP